ncbi:uncharacterized protein C8R40DRAFT_1105164 [Lentinula edodes]|uniref:uncharacterized protein n=1 Tax=Lentinula edodes TaxID=5353 RepID=UPI001E8D4276|nr:uncharacterized protein C8R40DRAFT_1105164 [Lentinula edodes]KAH7875162.1 hypothetical protein C8R40DRAFT_1105164 [Lentinula edodes]
MSEDSVFSTQTFFCGYFLSSKSTLFCVAFILFLQERSIYFSATRISAVSMEFLSSSIFVSLRHVQYFMPAFAHGQC